MLYACALRVAKLNALLLPFQSQVTVSATRCDCDRPNAGAVRSRCRCFTLRAALLGHDYPLQSVSITLVRYRLSCTRSFGCQSLGGSGLQSAGQNCRSFCFSPRAHPQSLESVESPRSGGFFLLLKFNSPPHRGPVPNVPLPLPSPLATPPLPLLAVPVIPLPIPLALPPLAPREDAADEAAPPAAPLPLLAGVRAEGTLLYLLGLDVVGGCSTKDVSVVRNVASTSGGATCVGMPELLGFLLDEGEEEKFLARAKDCGVGACEGELKVSIVQLIQASVATM